MGRAGHLVRRFAGSLVPRGPSAADAVWIAGELDPAERELFATMSRPDRRHAVGVARGAVAALDAGDESDPALSGAVRNGEQRRAVIAAALLHDVGKTVSGLGTYGRVVATLSAAVAGRSSAEAWAESRGFTRRVGLYLSHPRLGADLLGMAGSHGWVVAWARDHHRPEADWQVPVAVGRVLKAADDDGRPPTGSTGG